MHLEIVEMHLDVCCGPSVSRRRSPPSPILSQPWLAAPEARTHLVRVGRLRSQTARAVQKPLRLSEVGRVREPVVGRCVSAVQRCRSPNKSLDT